MSKLATFWSAIPVWWKRAIVFAFGGFVCVQIYSIVVVGEPLGVNLLEFMGLDFLIDIFRPSAA